MSIVDNYVKLSPGVPVSMRFGAIKQVNRIINDPLHGFSKNISVVDCQVIELNGKQVLTLFSATSKALQTQLLAYANAANLPSLRFTITQNGTGYLTQYSVAVGT